MPRLRSRAPPNPAPSTTPTASSARPRRGTTNQSPAAAVIQRSSPEETRQSIHLTVKSSPNKLRQATGGVVPKAGVSRQNIVAGKRASRSSRVVREIDSEEDDEEDEDEVEEADAMDVDDDEEDEDVDAEGDEDEDMDAEGEEDEDMDDTPAPRPVIPANRNIAVKPAISITKAQDSVEAKEMAMDNNSDDEELSDPDSDLDDDDAEGEDEDAEGEDDDDVDATMNDGLDDDMDSDEELGTDQTPDVTKMTKRQRAMVAEEEDGALMALSNEAQKKKHLTAEEHAMRRAEMARRRKNLSEKRQNEEKIDTINRLLKKQPPKRGRKAIQDITESGQEDEAEAEKANPLFVRYVHNAKGSQLAIPEEWLQAPVGKVFVGEMAKPASRPFGSRMVEEVA